MKKIVRKIGATAKEKAFKFQKEMRRNTITAISAGFAFLIALFWKDTITEIVNDVISKIGIPSSTLMYRLLIAVLVTLICVAGIVIISELLEEKEEKKGKK